MTDFQGVVDAWRKADPSKIHPTREHESEAAYWESGKPQAETVFDLVGPDGTVLDFGCGDGRIAIPMAKLGLTVIAVDTSMEFLHALGHHAADIENLDLWLSDGSDLANIIETPVDAVNARAVLIHHSHADVATLVHNLAAVLKPGGYLIADWPIGKHHERIDWIDVTTWNVVRRHKVATAAGLVLVSEGEPGKRPSVWRKNG